MIDLRFKSENPKYVSDTENSLKERNFSVEQELRLKFYGLPAKCPIDKFSTIS